MDNLASKMSSANIFSPPKLAQQPKKTDRSPTETCRAWALTSGCQMGAECDRAHHLFPIIINRTHRHPVKVETCEGWRHGTCKWPSDTCGFLHEEVDDQLRAGRDNIRHLVREQDWTSKLTLHCKYCRFEVVCKKQDGDEAFRMAKHCRECPQRKQSAAEKVVPSSTHELIMEQQMLASTSEHQRSSSWSVGPSEVSAPSVAISNMHSSAARPFMSSSAVPAPMANISESAPVDFGPQLMGSDPRGHNFPRHGSFRDYISVGQLLPDSAQLARPEGDLTSEAQEAERQKKASKDRKMGEEWWRPRDEDRSE